MENTNRLLSGLSLDRLRSFLLVAERSSIAKAAPHDEAKQSQIARQIRELEVFFGVELTRPRGNGIRITEAGRELAVLVQQHLQNLGDFLGRQRGGVKVFRIGTSESVLQWVVLPNGAGIRQALGGAALSFACLRSEEIVEKVRDGSLDFGILPEDAIPSGLARRNLGQLVLKLCVPEPLMRQCQALEGISASDAAAVSQFPFAVSRGQGEIDQGVRAALGKALGDFQAAYGCKSLVQVRECVMAGSAAGVLPSFGTNGLREMGVAVGPFGAECGNDSGGKGLSLCLHWNERFLRRRIGVESEVQLNAGVAIDAITRLLNVER